MQKFIFRQKSNFTGRDLIDFFAKVAHNGDIQEGTTW